MGKRKSLKITLFFSFILICYFYYLQLIEIIDFIIWFIFYNENEIMEYIFATGTVLSVFLFAKRYLYDTRLILNVQKEIGKKSLYDSLTVLHKLIKVLGTKETVRRIRLVDKTEYDMKDSINELHNVIIKKQDIIHPKFKLGFKSRFILSKRMLNVLRLMDKQIDINKIEESIKSSNKRNERREPIIENHRKVVKGNIIAEFNKKIKK